jgi:hypothetical protein
MEVTHSSETSVYNKPTQHHIWEDGILHSHRHENLKSYIAHTLLRIFLCQIVVNIGVVSISKICQRYLILIFFDKCKTYFK